METTGQHHTPLVAGARGVARAGGPAQTRSDAQRSAAADRRRGPGPWRSAAARTLLGAAVAYAALACGAGESPSDAPAEDRTVAVVGGRRISESELDRPLRIALHDLARDRYELRLARLRRLIEDRRSPIRGDVEPAAEGAADRAIRLEPPAPPRLDFELVGRPLYGGPEAPVTVLVFCDFDAPGCTALQPDLRTLVAEFPGRVRVAHRDLLRAPGGDPASVAAAIGCADEQGEIQRYLRAATSPPVRRGRAGLLRIARELRLNGAAFARCLDSGRQAAWAEESDSLARRMGIHTTPTAFVNGLYVRGAEIGEVRRLVSLELARLGEPSEPQELIANRVGLTLVGMVRSVRAQRSLATIRIAREKRARSFLPGETIVDDVVLERVREDGVFLREGERVEFLPVLPPPPARRLALRLAPPGPELRVEVGGPPADDVRVLGRDEVAAALDRRGDLESMLGVDESDAAGRGLLHLAEVEPGGLYDRLGLEPGDVLVEVNDAPIYDEDNPLWDALATDSRLHLVVRRDGATRESEIQIQ